MELIYLWSVLDSLDYDSNPTDPNLIVIGPGATTSDIGPGATLSCPSSLMSSEIPSVSGLSIKDTFHVQVASIPTNIPHFLTFIETSTRPVLLSIAQSHNITVPSKSALDVIRNLISDHVSSGACLGSSLPACTNLNASLCGQDCESSNDDLNDDFQLTLDLEIHILL